jgi:hypothetical protein
MVMEKQYVSNVLTEMGQQSFDQSKEKKGLETGSGKISLF